jgi:hypothetical protein
VYREICSPEAATPLVCEAAVLVTRRLLCLIFPRERLPKELGQRLSNPHYFRKGQQVRKALISAFGGDNLKSQLATPVACLAADVKTLVKLHHVRRFLSALHVPASHGRCQYYLHILKAKTDAIPTEKSLGRGVAYATLESHRLKFQFAFKRFFSPSSSFLSNSKTGSIGVSDLFDGFTLRVFHSVEITFCVIGKLQ